MTIQAQPRTIDGATYQDPLSYVTAGGYDREVARAVVNAYKGYFTANRRRLRLAPTWLEYVSNLLGLAEEICLGIMRRYRRFYGK